MSEITDGLLHSAKICERVSLTMEEHLALANKYERLGNHHGAAQLRSTANMLGMMLSNPEMTVPCVPGDWSDDEIKPKPNGFETYWKLHGKDAAWLAKHREKHTDDIEVILKDLLEDAWCAAQDQVDSGLLGTCGREV